jgi:hypothetical protein
MKDDKKNKVSLNEELRKIQYFAFYKINESPRYRPLINNGEEFDDVPVLTNEAGEQEDAEKPGGGEVPTEPSNDQPITGNAPVPAFDKEGGNVSPEGAEPMPKVDPAQEVDAIQNDIIKHNIEAMKSIHSMLQSLDNSVKELNAKVAELNAEVEEVREPTNSEKLMSKKEVSYPYYFNLNDFWNGNWFIKNREKELSKGIRELPDGTFIADFDDLPKESKIDIQNSFNELS